MRQEKLIFTDRSLYIWSSLVRLRTPGADDKPDTGDADLYRQLFIYLEQLEDLVRLRNPAAEAMT